MKVEITLSLCLLLAVAGAAFAATGPTNAQAGVTFVAFDLETTGFDSKRDRIIEIGAVRFKDGKTLDTRQWLVNPARPIPWNAQAVHGLSDKMVSEAPAFADVYAEFTAYAAGTVLLAHNAPFDMRFLTREALRNQLEPPTNAVLDTLRMARHCYPDAPGYALAALMDYLDVPAGSYHRALNDAACVRDLFFLMTADEALSINAWQRLAGTESPAR